MIQPQSMIAERRGGVVTIRVVDSLEGFSLLKDSWNALLGSSKSNHYFLRWEWLWAWWNVYHEPHHRLCILLAFREDELIGIGPFYLLDHQWRGVYKIRRLMFLGTKHGAVISEYMNVICKPGHEEMVVQKLLEFIIAEQLCDDIYLQQMEMNGKNDQILSLASRHLSLSCTFKETGRSPYIILPDSSEAFLRSCSASLRSQIKRGVRRLLTYPQVVFRRTFDSSELERDFTDLVWLHQFRWRMRGFAGAFSDHKFLRFQRLVMGQALDNDHLDLWFLSIGGRNIGALYNIKYQKRIYYYQSGLDCSFDGRLPAGVLLHNHCIAEAIHQGMEVYDFLFQGNMDAYKDRWTMESARIGNLYIKTSELSRYIGKARSAMGRSLERVKKSAIRWGANGWKERRLG